MPLSSANQAMIARLTQAAKNQYQEAALYGDFLLSPEGWPKQKAKLATLKRAAVALIVFENAQGELQLLLSQRAKGLRHHAAQVGFPGGRREPEDPSLYHSVLRECVEEISLPLKPDNLLCPMAPFASGSGFMVQPFLFYVPALNPQSLTLDPAEVDSLFSVSIDSLFDPAFSALGTFSIEGKKRYWVKFDTKPEVLWGLSAGIVAGLLRAAGAALNLNVPTPMAPVSLTRLEGIDDLLDDRATSLDALVPHP